MKVGEGSRSLPDHRPIWRFVTISQKFSWNEDNRAPSSSFVENVTAMLVPETFFFLRKSKITTELQSALAANSLIIISF